MRVWSAERMWVRGRFERDWAMMVDDQGIIQASGPRKQLVARARHVNHYPQSVILPAFVNPHHQGFHQLFKGIAAQTNQLDDYMGQLVYPFSQMIDEDLMEAIYRTAYAEQLKSGISNVGEFHYLHHGGFEKKGESLAEKAIRIALEMGIKITLVYALFDQGNSEETKAFIEPLDESIRQFVRLQETYKNHTHVRIVPGVHSLAHTSAEAIIAASDLARKYHKPLHIQLATHPRDLEEAQVQYGTTPLRAIEKMGLLKNGLVVVHANYLEREELKMLKDCAAGLITCPTSSQAKGEQLPDYGHIYKLDIPITFGSEMASMNLNFAPCHEFQAMEYELRRSMGRMNIMAQRTPNQLFEYVSSVPQAMLGGSEGQLMPGSPADFICVSLEGPDYRPHWDFNGPTFQNLLMMGWRNGLVTQTVVHGEEVYSSPAFKSAKLDRAYRKLDDWSAAFNRSLEHQTQDKAGQEITQEAAGNA
ncbi:MAG: amidohydrolase family protein [Acidobacteria bacterium]|nr:amidohydrolase family protein [Acidobacteriota bacterium]MCB9397519.1 amidohydrolase family protein [Acidobacteriota bacterium]